MLKFLICLLAYPNVRTEPQHNIGRNRGKKKASLCLEAPRLHALETRGRFHQKNRKERLS